MREILRKTSAVLGIMASLALPTPKTEAQVKDPWEAEVKIETTNLLKLSRKLEKYTEYPRIEFLADTTPIGAYTQMCERAVRAMENFCEGFIGQPKFYQNLDENLFNRLIQINSYVNKAIVYKTDKEKHGVEDFWEYKIVTTGDCDEFTLNKYILLTDKTSEISFRPNSFSLLFVNALNNQNKPEGHLVLVFHAFINGRQVDLLLDNFKDSVHIVSESKHEFVSGTSPRGTWTSIKLNLAKEY